MTVTARRRDDLARGPSLGALDDASLVALASDRDEAAFVELMTRHRRVVNDVCGYLTMNRADTEDAVQAVQMAVWMKIHTFRGDAQFSTWLYRVAYNTTMGLLRRPSAPPTDDAPDTACPRTMDQTVCDVQAVRWALRRLSPEQRITLVLKECHDLSIEEIARVLIVSRGTVKSRLSRARAKMAHLLTEVC